jgi:hypothetical protein
MWRCGWCCLRVCGSCNGGLDGGKEEEMSSVRNLGRLLEERGVDIGRDTGGLGRGMSSGKEKVGSGSGTVWYVENEKEGGK